MSTRVTRTPPAGEKKLETGVVVGTSTAVGISNAGVTEVSTATGTEVVLGAPVEGVEKTIYCLGITTTTASVTVRGSVGTDVTFNKAGNTQIVFSATVDMAVDLLGLSSTRWLVRGVYPPALAVNSTGVVVGSS